MKEQNGIGNLNQNPVVSSDSPDKTFDPQQEPLPEALDPPSHNAAQRDRNLRLKYENTLNYENSRNFGENYTNRADFFPRYPKTQYIPRGQRSDSVDNYFRKDSMRSLRLMTDAPRLRCNDDRPRQRPRRRRAWSPPENCDYRPRDFREDRRIQDDYFSDFSESEFEPPKNLGGGGIYSEYAPTRIYRPRPRRKRRSFLREYPEEFLSRKASLPELKELNVPVSSVDRTGRNGASQGKYGVKVLLFEADKGDFDFKIFPVSKDQQAKKHDCEGIHYSEKRLESCHEDRSCCICELSKKHENYKNRENCGNNENCKICENDNNYINHKNLRNYNNCINCEECDSYKSCVNCKKCQKISKNNSCSYKGPSSPCRKSGCSLCPYCIMPTELERPFDILNHQTSVPTFNPPQTLTGGFIDGTPFNLVRSQPSCPSPLAQNTWATSQPFASQPMRFYRPGLGWRDLCKAI